MPASLSIIATDVVLGLNAGSGYSSVVTDPRWSTQQIVDAVLHSDGLVVAACIEDPNNPYASGYYTTLSGIAHGGIINASFGGIVTVQFVLTGGGAPSVRPGIMWDLADIIFEIRNTLALRFDPHFQLHGRVLYHNGASIAAYESAVVSVNVITLTYSRSSACQAPDILSWLVFVGAMALLVPVEGENTGAAGYWGELFFKGLEAISKGKAIPTGIEDAARAHLAQMQQAA